MKLTLRDKVDDLLGRSCSQQVPTMVVSNGLQVAALGRMLALEGDNLMLEFPEALAQATDGHGLEPCAVSFSLEGVAYVFRTELLQVTMATVAGSSQAAIGVFAKPTEISGIERRKSFRVPVHSSAGVNATVDLDAGSLDVAVLNLSLHGMLVELPPESAEQVPVDQPVSITITMGSDSARLQGKLYRRHGANAALSFSGDGIDGRPRSAALTRMLEVLKRSWLSGQLEESAALSSAGPLRPAPSSPGFAAHATTPADGYPAAAPPLRRTPSSPGFAPNPPLQRTPSSPGFAPAPRRPSSAGLRRQTPSAVGRPLQPLELDQPDDEFDDSPTPVTGPGVDLSEFDDLPTPTSATELEEFEDLPTPTSDADLRPAQGAAPRQSAELPQAPVPAPPATLPAPPAPVAAPPAAAARPPGPANAPMDDEATGEHAAVGAPAFRAVVPPPVSHIAAAADAAPLAGQLLSADQLLVQAIDQCELSVELVDREGLLVRASPAFTSCTGHDCAASVGQALGPLLAAGTRTPDVYDRIFAAAARGRSWVGQVDTCRRDGSQIIHNLTVFPVRSPAGEVTHFLLLRREGQ